MDRIGTTELIRRDWEGYIRRTPAVRASRLIRRYSLSLSVLTCGAGAAGTKDSSTGAKEDWDNEDDSMAA